MKPSPLGEKVVQIRDISLEKRGVKSTLKHRGPSSRRLLRACWLPRLDGPDGHEKIKASLRQGRRRFRECRAPRPYADISGNIKVIKLRAQRHEIAPRSPKRNWRRASPTRAADSVLGIRRPSPAVLVPRSSG